jgi:hypothetical protein
MKNPETDPYIMGKPIILKQATIIILVTFMIGLILFILIRDIKGISDCSSQTIHVGERAPVQRSAKIQLSNLRKIQYTGMVSDSVFSIVWIGREKYNLYYPVTVNTLEIEGYKIEIIKVTPEYLQFKIIGRDL